MSYSLSDIVRHFILDVNVEAYGNGHINDTYIADSDPKYILQRINHSICAIQGFDNGKSLSVRITALSSNFFAQELCNVKYVAHYLLGIFKNRMIDTLKDILGVTVSDVGIVYVSVSV